MDVINSIIIENFNLKRVVLIL